AELQGEMMGVAEQVLSSIAVVQAFGGEPHEDRRFEAVTHRTGRAYVRSTLAQYHFSTATTIVTAAGTAGVMVLGGLHAAGHEISVGSLVLFLSYLASLYQPLEDIAYVASGLAQVTGGARRVLSVLEVQEHVPEHAGARPLNGSGPV